MAWRYSSSLLNKKGIPDMERKTLYGTELLISQKNDSDALSQPPQPQREYKKAKWCFLVFCAALVTLFLATWQHSRQTFSNTTSSPVKHSAFRAELMEASSHQKQPRSLMLLRHAKSSWKNLKLLDYERPLAKQGGNQAKKLGNRLKRQKVPEPEIIIASPAARTRQTLELIQEQGWASQVPVVFDEHLYTLAFTSYRDFVKHHLDARFHHVLLVGHNPAMHKLAKDLFKDTDPKEVKQFRPGEFCQVEWEHLAKWSHLDQATATNTNCILPR